MVDQISTHGSSSYSVKMLPVLPISFFGRHHAEIYLIHQLGGLQAVVLALPLHKIVSQPTQVGQYQREELVFSLAAPRPPFVEKVRDVSGRVVHITQRCGRILPYRSIAPLLLSWRTFPRFTLYTARVSNPVLESPEKGAVMKSLKQTVVVTIFAALACTALHAQSVRLQATIPFDFRAGDKLMPAGEYAIQEQGSITFLRAADGKSNLA